MSSLFYISVAVWEDEGSGGKLYLGGYKAAVNIKWLRQAGIGLIVNTARGLDQVLGPKYLQNIQRRQTECQDIKIKDYLLTDDLKQKLEVEDLIDVALHISTYLNSGISVLVHCAQVK